MIFLKIPAPEPNYRITALDAPQKLLMHGFMGPIARVMKKILPEKIMHGAVKFIGALIVIIKFLDFLERHAVRLKIKN